MPTRFWFPGSETSPISPAADAAWDVAPATVRRLSHKKSGSAIAIGSTITVGATTPTGYGDRQYISDPILGDQTISGTVKMQLMVREFNNLDNVNWSIVGARVVSNDGTTVRGTLLTVGNRGPASTEFINNASCRNETFLDGDAISSVSALNGDRIVVEIGYGCSGTGTTPQAAAKYGENAADLPENESQATDGAGWIEFSGDIKFVQAKGNALLLGVGN